MRQRVIVLDEYTARYCHRPPTAVEVMPWGDDFPHITEGEEVLDLPPLDG